MIETIIRVLMEGDKTLDDAWKLADGVIKWWNEKLTEIADPPDEDEVFDVAMKLQEGQSS